MSGHPMLPLQGQRQTSFSRKWVMSQVCWDNCWRYPSHVLSVERPQGLLAQTLHLNEVGWAEARAVCGRDPVHRVAVCPNVSCTAATTMGIHSCFYKNYKLCIAILFLQRKKDYRAEDAISRRAVFLPILCDSTAYTLLFTCEWL